MSDLSLEDVERIRQEISKVAGSMDGYVKAMMTKQKEDRDTRKAFWTKLNTNTKQLDRNVAEMMETFGRAGKSADSMLSYVNSLARYNGKLFAGMAVMTSLAMAGSKLNETWREMTEVGQTFGGSMFTMLNAANAAGLPLETFAKLQRAHNVTINAMGNSFWAVNKQLRQNLRVSGMYGMSMEQLGEFTATYMETSRLNGSAQSRSQRQLTSDMGDLALTTTALAKASDKTRTQIMELATSAMSSALSLAAIRTMPLELRGIMDKSVKTATAGFAAMNGEAGEFFARFFNDSLGGNSTLTSGGETAVNAGMSGLASAMDQTARAIAAGADPMKAQMEMQNRFVDEISANMGQLRIQALAGNQDAAKLIQMYAANSKKVSMADLEKAKATAATTESLTAFFSSLEDIFSQIKTAFGKGFMDAFGKAFGKLDNLANSPAIEAITKFMGKLGTQLGTLLGTALSEANINGLIKGIGNITTGLFDFFSAVASAGPLWTVLGSMISVITSSIGFAISMFDKLGEGGQKLVGGFLGAFLLFKGVKSLIGKLFGNNMVVNANNVIVNGGSGGGVGGGKGLRGAASRMRGGAGRLGRAFRGGTRGLGGLGKGAAGLLGRAAPFLGVGLEGLDYATGDKSMSWRNLAKSGLSLGGGALGALGAGAVSGGLGSVAGGIGGYAGGKALGDWMLGPDDKRSPAASATKAATAATAAAASIAATNSAMMQSAKNDDGMAGGTPAVNPMQVLIDEVKALRQAMQRGDQGMNARLDKAVNLLSKIEVSAQSI